MKTTFKRQPLPINFDHLIVRRWVKTSGDKHCGGESIKYNLPSCFHQPPPYSFLSFSYWCAFKLKLECHSNTTAYCASIDVCLANAQVAPQFFMFFSRKANYCCTQYIARKGKQLSPLNTSSKNRPGAYTLLYVFIKLRAFLKHIWHFRQWCGFVNLRCFLCFLFTVNLGKRFKTAKLRFQGSKLFFKVQQPLLSDTD